MKILRLFLPTLLLFITSFAIAKSPPCDAKEFDLAQIISGTYNCDIVILTYGKDDVRKKGSVKINKVGNNKVQISTAGAPSYTSPWFVAHETTPH